MNRKSGFSLIELMLAVVIAAIGLFAISALLYSAYTNWFAGKEVKELQEDMDLASLTVKSVLEEAEWSEDSIIISDGGTSITVSGKNALDEPWQKKLYKSGSELRLQDITAGSEYTVIRTLTDVAFYKSQDYGEADLPDDWQDLQKTLVVKITVAGSARIAGRTLENRFLVYLRN